MGSDAGEGDTNLVVICYASEIKGCGRRTSELSNAPLHMKQDTNSIENFKVLRF